MYRIYLGLKFIATALLFYTGISRLLFKLASSGQKKFGFILTFHRLYYSGSPVYLGISVSRFKAYLKYLNRHFDLVPLNELLANGNGSSPQWKRPRLAITFDDGFRDNLTHGLRIYERHAIPVTIFITTGFLDSDHVEYSNRLFSLFMRTSKQHLKSKYYPERLSMKSLYQRYLSFINVSKYMRLNLRRDPKMTDRFIRGIAEELGVREMDESKNHLYMTSKQVAGVDSEFVTFGAHTVSHPTFSTISPDDKRREISESVLLLRQLTDRNVRFFAFPFGEVEDIGEITEQFFEQTGIRAAFCNYPGIVDKTSQRYSLNRFNIPTYPREQPLCVMMTVLAIKILYYRIFGNSDPLHFRDQSLAPQS